MVGVFTIGIITTIAISANIKQSDKLKSLNITSNANYKYCALNYTVRSIITENNLINNIIDVKYDDNHIISKFNLKYLDNNLPFIIDQSINTISQFKNNIIHHEYLYHTNNLHTVIYMRVR
jgi:hypothetical protein